MSVRSFARAVLVATADPYGHQRRAAATAARAAENAARLSAVLALHLSVAEPRSDPADPRCTCGSAYPCPTRLAATGTTRGGEPRG